MKRFVYIIFLIVVLCLAQQASDSAKSARRRAAQKQAEQLHRALSQMKAHQDAIRNQNDLLLELHHERWRQEQRPEIGDFWTPEELDRLRPPTMRERKS